MSKTGLIFADKVGAYQGISLSYFAHSLTHKNETWVTIITKVFFAIEAVSKI
jgi:hypothetical protein